MPYIQFVKKKDILTIISLELFNLIFESLEVVSRYRDTLLQVTGNWRYL